MKKRIMIVEDESIIAFTLKVYLLKRNYEVLEIITSGHDAIEQAFIEQPDLILMDIFLSDDVDGIDAVIEIHKKYDIPIIYLTASSDLQTFERAQKTKYSGFITKPYTLKDLNEIIQTSLH